MILKEIENFKGYFVSDNGTIFCNLGKGNRRKGRTVPLYPITPRQTKNGYMRIYARNSTTNKRQDLYVHRLVGEYFIPNPHHKRVINHKNCNRADNRASNLEWVTTKENVEYSMNLKHLLRDEKTGRLVSGL